MVSLFPPKNVKMALKIAKMNKERQPYSYKEIKVKMCKERHLHLSSRIIMHNHVYMNAWMIMDVESRISTKIFWVTVAPPPIAPRGDPLIVDGQEALIEVNDWLVNH